MKLIDVQAISKTFPPSGAGRRDNSAGLAVVSEVSFSMEKGEILGIVGQSGSGKTTLARIVLRLLQPTSGRVLFEGNDVFAMTPEQVKTNLRARARMIFQHPDSALNPAFTVKKVIEQALRLHSKHPPGDWNDVAASLLGEVGLSADYLGKYPAELSGGEKRRVAICRALATSPVFILGDEPVSGLDVTLQHQILELFLKLREERGLTLLLITHDLAVVRAYADRIGIMHRGRLIDYGSYEELMAREEELHPFSRELFAAEYRM